MISALIKNSRFFGRLLLELVHVYFRNQQNPFLGFKFPGGSVPPNWSFDAMASSSIRIQLWGLLPGQEFSLLMHRISKYWEASSKDSALRPDLWDLLQQARMMRFLNPSRTIEFGSGNSTVVGMSSPGEFTSVESSDFFASKTRQYLRNAGFTSEEVKNVKHAVAKLTAWPATGEHVWLHDIHLEPADFIYIDGPPLNEQSSVAADVIVQNLVKNNTVILFDSRKDNAIWLQKALNLSGGDWRLMVLPYPSNDCLLMSFTHPRWEEFTSEFFLTPGGPSPGPLIAPKNKRGRSPVVRSS